MWQIIVCAIQLVAIAVAFAVVLFVYACAWLLTVEVAALLSRLNKGTAE